MTDSEQAIERARKALRAEFGHKIKDMYVLHGRINRRGFSFRMDDDRYRFEVKSMVQRMYKDRVDLENEVEAVFNPYIRKSRGNFCEFHKLLESHPEIVDPQACGGYMSCCHKYGRAKKKIKFNERNVFCGCSSINQWANLNQSSWKTLWRKLWPEDAEYLDLELKRSKVKLTVDYLQNKLKEYKDKLARL